VTIENAEAYIKSHKADGADYIKLMQENCCSLAAPNNSIPVATLELQTAVVRAAHAHDMICVGHATAVENTEILLRAGIDGLAHTFIDQPPTPSIIDLYKSTNAFVIPTLTVLAALTGELAPYRARFASLATSPAHNLLTDNQRDNLLATLNAGAPDATVDNAFASVRALQEAKIDVVAGTDSVAGLQGTQLGVSLWMELELYVKECGFGVEEALRAATGTTARRFGFKDRGVVEVGRRADLVLVNEDLRKGLEGLWGGEDGKHGGIVGVWKDGILADRGWKTANA
jgi:imidazolonepropionase-like amidohydrolase